MLQVLLPDKALHTLYRFYPIFSAFVQYWKVSFADPAHENICSDIIVSQPSRIVQYTEISPLFLHHVIMCPN